AHHAGDDLHRRQPLEELALRAARHRPGRPLRHRRGHPQRLRQDRRGGRPRDGPALRGDGPLPGRDDLPADDPRPLLRGRPGPDERRRRDRGRLLGHHRQGDRPPDLRPARRPLPPGPARLRQRLVRRPPHPRELRRARPGGGRPRLQGAQVRPVRRQLPDDGPHRAAPLAGDRPRRPRGRRPRDRDHDRGPLPLLRRRGGLARRAAGRVRADLVRGADPPPEDRRRGRGRPQGHRADRHRRELLQHPPVRRAARPQRRPHPPARAGQHGRDLAHPAGQRDGRRPLRGRRPPQRAGADLDRDLPPARRLHPEPARPGALRRVQRRMGARVGRPPRDARRRPDPAPRGAGPGRRSELGRGRQAPLRGLELPAALRHGLGAPRGRPDRPAPRHRHRPRRRRDRRARAARRL
ncbi:MAG: Galactonate dehydratase, partial [uncultured Thermomicrobiales bacterium]